MKTHAIKIFLLLVLAAAAAVLSCQKDASTGGSGAAVQKEVYFCPMHPQITSTDPNYKCPICGMDLVERKDAVQAAGHALHDDAKPLAQVTISLDQKRLLGITYGTVERRSISREIRTSARVVPDETRLFRVTTKIEGYVDELYVNVTGQAVNKGDPLLAVYSPELVASQEEFLTAVNAARAMAGSSHEAIAQGAADLVAAARRRLRLWDISEAQIARIERTGRVEKNLQLFAPAGGFVTEKNVLAGQKIMPGDALLTIADLSQVWAEADIYESDLPYIAVGMPATLTLPYWPGKECRGTVSFLNPFLDRETRTLKARMNIDNPDLVLKPEMLGQALLRYRLGERLAVPESAVLRTGTKQYVFKAGRADHLTPVEVTLGLRAEGWFEVAAGLAEGDRVVTSANFLIDSESSLKAALQAVSGGGHDPASH
jgi:RND family efflux transporter MFP subunit